MSYAHAPAAGTPAGAPATPTAASGTSGQLGVSVTTAGQPAATESSPFTERTAQLTTPLDLGVEPLNA